MKKVICVLLAVSLMLSVAAPVFADEFDDPLFASIPVEYSDATGTIELLEVMVQDGRVYAEAFALAERLGYKCALDGSHLSISINTIESYHKVPFIDVDFFVDDTKVYYNPPGGIYREYTAPYPCQQNDRGTWIPLQYALVLLGGNSQVFDDALYIQMPEENVLSISSIIAIRGSLLSFDWEDDFGYSEFASNVTDGAARVVTLFNGLLEFDGRSWSSFVDWNAFDKKFGKSLAAMFCSYSTAELLESTKDLETMLDVFGTKGKTGEMLRSKQLRLDTDVILWKDTCSEYLKKLEAGSGSPIKYNLLYQQYERAMDDQLLFSKLGGEATIEIQDKISSATNVLEAAKLIGYGVSYLSEYQQKDSFMLSVLRNYLTTRDVTDELSDATANAMLKYVNKIDGNIMSYGLYQFLEEHALETLIDGTSLDVLLGAPANIVLLAWDIMSSTIPFYDKGLESVEHREISNYAQQVQNDAQENIYRLLDQLRPNDEPLTSEQCVQLAEYCYIYLKACYIARESAIKSLDGISEEAMNRVNSKIQAEEDVNDQIVKYLSVLSRVNAENSCYILGFLPANNEEYLEMGAGKAITTEWVVENSTVIDCDNLVSDAFTDYGLRNDGYVNNYRIPKINISGKDANETNAIIYNDLYYGVYEKIENKRGNCGDSGITYSWTEQNGIISILVRWAPEDYTGHGPIYYKTYNASSQTGELLSIEDVADKYEMTLDEYYTVVKKQVSSCCAEVAGPTEYHSQYFDKMLDEMTSLSNIQSSMPFINSNGNLCCVSKVYYDIVGEVHETLLNLTGNTTPEAPAFSWDMPEDSDYMNVLQSYPKTAEYTLYDINKDGLYELIVHGRDYDVYTLSGAGAVLCGSCDAYYHGLYAFDGNGLIVHNGGSGYLHLEYVSLYTLSDNVFKDTEGMINTEENSIDELHNYLSKYTKITNFYPVSDYSLLTENSSAELTPLQNWVENCDTKKFTNADLETFDSDDCRLARNAIFAKSGRIFSDKALQQYFEQFDWYHPTVSPDDFSNSMLNDIQLYNRDLIINYEESRGYR